METHHAKPHLCPADEQGPEGRRALETSAGEEKEEARSQEEKACRYDVHHLGEEDAEAV